MVGEGKNRLSKKKKRKIKIIRSEIGCKEGKEGRKKKKKKTFMLQKWEAEKIQKRR